MANEIKKGSLYLVATPIGNLSDLSPRAIKTLSEVDFVAAEDTRVTLKLLTYFDIKKPLISYYAHNIRERGEQIIARLLAGESCALVSDAGTPAISDPGEDMVRLCRERGIDVYSVPGCCAAISALILSGQKASRFAFEGFLSMNKNERRARLEELKRDRHTLIFYEAPHKLKNTLRDLYENFGNRRISLVREITKINEETIVTTLEEAQSLYLEKEPKGEYVLVLEGFDPSSEAPFWAEMEVREHFEYYLGLGMDRKEAVKKVASDRGVAKNRVYIECMTEKDK